MQPISNNSIFISLFLKRKEEKRRIEKRKKRFKRKFYQ